MTNVSFSMFSGNTKSVMMPIKNEKNNQAVNLTGCTGEFTIAEFVNPKPEHIFCQGPISIFDAAGGIIQFVIEPEKTVGKAGVYPFDVKITFPDGAIKTVYFGWVEIKAVVND